MHMNSTGTARVTAPLFTFHKFKYTGVYNQHTVITHSTYITLLIPVAKDMVTHWKF